MNITLHGDSKLLKYTNTLLNKRLEAHKRDFSVEHGAASHNGSIEEIECLLARLDYDEQFGAPGNDEIDEIDFKACLTDETELVGLAKIGDRFRLTGDALKILLLLTVFEIDETYRKIFRFLSDGDGFNRPSVKVLLNILYENKGVRRKKLFEIIESSMVRTFHLVRLSAPHEEASLLHHEFHINPMVLHWIMGSRFIRDSLTEYMTVLPAVESKDAPEALLKRSDQIAEKLRGDNSIIYFLHGPRGTGKKEHARMLAGIMRSELVIVDTAMLMSVTDQWVREFKQILLYAALTGSLIYCENFDAFFSHEKYELIEKAFIKILTDFKVLFMAGSSRSWSPESFDLHLHYIKEEFTRPDFTSSVGLWENALSAYVSDTSVITDLANMFNFSETEIERMGMLASGILPGKDGVSPEELFTLCRENTQARMRGLARPVKTSYTLTDIVLPQPQKHLLMDFISYWKNRHTVLDEWGFSGRTNSRGVTALFNGPPGTGKTMAAGILARELNLQAYNIDLSQLVSKYIGETEKNLENIFDTAEGQGILLFFDEADSVFGKRTEVGDSHDRFANIEVSYLLQRIENYNGPIIMATNFLKNIDEAFMRRIQFIVEFARPDKEQSMMIWQKVFPAKAPLADDIDFEFLTDKFKFTGGNIRNIALGSAFYAIEEESEIIGMRHVIIAVKSELKKLGKLCNPLDFGKYWIEDWVED